MGCWPVHDPANCAHKKPMHFFLGESHGSWRRHCVCTLTRGQVVRVSSQTVATNCPLMKQLCFPSSRQMLSVRPRLHLSALFPHRVPLRSSPSHSVHVFGKAMWGRHSKAWLKAWKQILAGLYESWDHSGPPLTTYRNTQHFQAQYSDPLLR